MSTEAIIPMSVCWVAKWLSPWAISLLLSRLSWSSLLALKLLRLRIVLSYSLNRVLHVLIESLEWRSYLLLIVLIFRTVITELGLRLALIDGCLVKMLVKRVLLTNNPLILRVHLVLAWTNDGLILLLPFDLAASWDSVCCLPHLSSNLSVLFRSQEFVHSLISVWTRTVLKERVELTWFSTMLLACWNHRVFVLLDGRSLKYILFGSFSEPVTCEWHPWKWHFSEVLVLPVQEISIKRRPIRESADADDIMVRALLVGGTGALFDHLN